ncbi:MAG: hypothetical protein AAF662_02835 [Pseudomonadota bacterium]
MHDTPTDDMDQAARIRAEQLNDFELVRYAAVARRMGFASTEFIEAELRIVAKSEISGDLSDANMFYHFKPRYFWCPATQAIFDAVAERGLEDDVSAYLKESEPRLERSQIDKSGFGPWNPKTGMYDPPVPLEPSDSEMNYIPIGIAILAVLVLAAGFFLLRPIT